MRAYACAREGVIVDIFTLRKIQFLVGDSSIVFSHPNILGKQHVTFHKTTRRFHKNKPSFSPKQAVVFTRTSRCFHRNKPSFYEQKQIVKPKSVIVP